MARLQQFSIALNPESMNTVFGQVFWLVPIFMSSQPEKVSDLV